MKNIICLLLIDLLMVSCVTRKACDRKFPTYNSDSVSIVTNTITVIRDTIIYVRIPGDTVFASVPVGEVSKLSTGIATSTAWVKDGKLEHRLEQKDSTLGLQIKDALKTTTNYSKKNERIQKTQFINQLSDWQRFQIKLCKILIVTFLVVTVWLLFIRNLKLNN